MSLTTSHQIVLAPSVISGSLQAPASKSALQRALLLASVADAPSLLRHASYCDDVMAVVEVARMLGAKVKLGPTIHVTPRGRPLTDPLRLHVSESGFALRSLATFAATRASEVILSGQGTLLNRPLAPISSWVGQFGLVTADDSWPYHITGRLRSGRYDIAAAWSSQVLSGLLMSLPLVSGDSQLHVRDMVSGPYIDLTVAVMSAFGIEIERPSPGHFIIAGDQHYQGTIYDIEGDWSGAANLLVAAALTGSIALSGLREDDHQADIAIIDILRSAGAEVEWIDEMTIKVSRSTLRPFHADLTDSPDLFPPVVVLALGSDGESTLKGVDRLGDKESDRAATLLTMVEALGGSMRRQGDRLIIQGTGHLCGGEVSSHEDHRIAMAAAVASCLCTRDVSITGAQSVRKSYPGFYHDLARLGMDIRPL